MYSNFIVVILDPDFGDKLRQIDNSKVIWICDSKNNYVVANELWAQSKKTSEQISLTTFQYDKTKSSAEMAVDIIQDVDLHNAWNTIEFYGVSLSKDLIASLTNELSESFHVHSKDLKFESSNNGFKIIQNKLPFYNK